MVGAVTAVVWAVATAAAWVAVTAAAWVVMGWEAAASVWADTAALVPAVDGALVWAVDTASALVPAAALLRDVLSTGAEISTSGGYTIVVFVASPSVAPSTATAIVAGSGIPRSTATCAPGSADW